MGGGADQQIVRFREKRLGGFTVNFAGRSKDNAFVMLCCRGQNSFRPLNIGQDRADRIVNDQFHTHSGGKMEHGITFRHQHFQVLCHENIALDEAVVWIVLKGSNVIKRTGGKIIDHRNGMSGRKQRTGQVTADKTCAAGDQNFHRIRPQSFSWVNSTRA